MLNNVLKSFFKNFFDENVKRKTTKILTFSNRFFREMYVIAEKSRRTKQKFQKLQNEKNQFNALNFYKKIVKRNMFSEQIQVLMTFYTNQHISFYFFRSNQSFLSAAFSPVSSKIEFSYQYKNHSHMFFNQYFTFSEQFYQNSVFQNYSVSTLHYDTNQDQGQSFQQNQFFQESNLFYQNLQSSQSKSTFYNYYSFQSFQHLESVEWRTPNIQHSNQHVKNSPPFLFVDRDLSASFFKTESIFWNDTNRDRSNLSVMKKSAKKKQNEIFKKFHFFFSSLMNCQTEINLSTLMWTISENGCRAWNRFVLIVKNWDTSVLFALKKSLKNENKLILN